MGGGSVVDDERALLISACYDISNVVLLGRTWNGKRATGNSIVGGKAFKSGLSLNGVTMTTQAGKTVVDGHVLNVIDCPGMPSSSLHAT